MQELKMNPYVVQIDKFVSSLDKLSHAFLRMEENKNVISEEEYQGIREDVRERVCKGCERKKVCHGVDMLQDVLYTIEKYGAELNVETKRKMQKKCVNAPQFLRAVVDVYKNEKHNQMWKHRMAENREGCAVQLDSFAQMIQHSTRELGASIFEDEHLEKKIKTRFVKMGLKLLSTVFLVTEKWPIRNSRHNQGDKGGMCDHERGCTCDIRVYRQGDGYRQGGARHGRHGIRYNCVRRGTKIPYSSGCC